MKDKSQQRAYYQTYYQKHKKEQLQKNKRWEKNHPEKYKLLCSRRNKTQYRKHQRIVLEHYSQGKLACAYCGFNDIRALSIDHINGGGEKARREAGVSGDGFYRWLIKNNFPDGLQVLCMNCQFIKRHTNNEFPNTK